jgi:4a-hydroxytetrahydrobiopterin dehydratase
MTDDTQRLYEGADLARALADAGLGGWSPENDAIRRRFATDGWPTTLMLTNAIGYACEAAFHHADLEIGWGEVLVKLTTHSRGGVTDNDLEMARRIDEVALWRPAGGDALEGTPNDWVRPA